jgi:hypothetical protein
MRYRIKSKHGWVDEFIDSTYIWTTDKSTSWIMLEEEANRRLLKVRETVPDAVLDPVGWKSK